MNLGDPASSRKDRIRPPAATVRAMRPFLHDLGVTRVARQTGLDRIGIPSFAAIRPNAATLAVNQGKGADDDAAEASAIMEAAEYCVAENPAVATHFLSTRQVLAAGLKSLDVTHLLPPDAPLDKERKIHWIEGTELHAGDAILVPYDAVVIGGTPRDLPQISQSTNGLASGNCLDEAVFHGLCELVERDAASLWVFKPDKGMRLSCIAPEAFGDAEVDRLAGRIRASRLRINLFDQTTDLAIPCIMAVIGPADRTPSLHFDLATGAGCHPVAAFAALRAITEAAQTRISNIAGARDDFDPGEYGMSLSQSLAAHCEPIPAQRGVPAGASPGSALSDLVGIVSEAVAKRTSRLTALVPLGGDRFGISVVKLFAPGLEDRLTNRNWRPGPRAAAAMMRFW
ncbi:MAG: YcaO-like family protein [Devosia sp.]